MIPSMLRKVTARPSWTGRLGPEMRMMYASVAHGPKPSRALLMQPSPLLSIRSRTVPALYGASRGMWAEAERKDFLKDQRENTNRSVQTFQKHLEEFRKDSAAQKGELAPLLKARASAAEAAVRTATSTMNEEMDLVENSILTDDTTQNLDGLFLARDILDVAIASSERQLQGDIQHAQRVLSSSDPTLQAHLKLKWIESANGGNGGKDSPSYSPSASTIASMSNGLSQASGELPVELSTIEAEERAMYGKSSNLPMTSNLVKAIHQDAQALHRRLKSHPNPYSNMPSEQAMVMDEVLQEVEDGAAYPDIHPYSKEFAPRSSGEQKRASAT